MAKLWECKVIAKVITSDVNIEQSSIRDILSQEQELTVEFLGESEENGFRELGYAFPIIMLEKWLEQGGTLPFKYCKEDLMPVVYYNMDTNKQQSASEVEADRAQRELFKRELILKEEIRMKNVLLKLKEEELIKSNEQASKMWEENEDLRKSFISWMKPQSESQQQIGEQKGSSDKLKELMEVNIKPAEEDVQKDKLSNNANGPEQKVGRAEQKWICWLILGIAISYIGYWYFH